MSKNPKLTKQDVDNLINRIENKLNTKDNTYPTIIKRVVELRGKDIDCKQPLVIEPETKVFIKLDKDITVADINLGNDSEVHIIGGYKVYFTGCLVSGLNSLVEPDNAIYDVSY